METIDSGISLIGLWHILIVALEFDVSSSLHIHVDTLVLHG